VNLTVVQAAVEAGERSKNEMAKAMAEFQAACITGHWDMTECARAKAHDNLDAFFDHLATIYRSRK
jgi:hypothetical protein